MLSSSVHILIQLLKKVIYKSFKWHQVFIVAAGVNAFSLHLEVAFECEYECE